MNWMRRFGFGWKAAAGGAVLACCAAAAWGSTGYTATGTLGSGDAGKKLQDGTVYVVPSDATISRIGTTSSALYVADNATAVVFIPQGVTLRVFGGNGNGATSAGAGIRVNPGSTLVVTGGGMLDVMGGGGERDVIDGAAGVFDADSVITFAAQAAAHVPAVLFAVARGQFFGNYCKSVERGLE
jgi:hypothetical protein